MGVGLPTVAPSGPVIVCCSAEDRPYLERLRQHVKPLRRGAVVLWERDDIPAGAPTREVERDAWTNARGVVLLVSPPFLADEFAPGSEVHAAVLDAQARGLPILWIPVSYSAHDHTELGAIQSLHDPERPLDSLSEPEANRALVDISEKLVDAVTRAASDEPSTSAAQPGGGWRAWPRKNVIAAATGACLLTPLLIWLALPDTGTEHEANGDDATPPVAAASPGEPAAAPAEQAPSPAQKPSPAEQAPSPAAPELEQKYVVPPEAMPLALVEALAEREATDCTRIGGCPVRWDGPRVEAFVSGGGTGCVVTADGLLRCWGVYAGLGTLHGGAWPWTAELASVSQVDVGGKVREVALGSSHICALMELHGRVRCWGVGNGLGYGPTQPLGDEPGEMPTADVAVGLPAEHVVAGKGHTCVLVTGGTVRCWGSNGDGQLGNGHDEDVGDDVDEMPPVAVQDIAGAIQLVAGDLHNCVLLQAGSVRCWGNNSDGQLGDGSTTSSHEGSFDSHPPSLVDLGAPVEQITAGENHTCALLRGGMVRCWGFNGHSQLGYEDKQCIGDQPGEMPPADVVLGGKVMQIAAGSTHTCALLETKTVRCWGGRWIQGQLGHGVSQTRRDHMPPLDVPIGGDVETLISLGGNFSCARLVDGSLRCWGGL
jgi:hypothetical protein